ncbi:MAG TPA: fumarylacetoacetate hydrolase family protein [Terriglobia bacterium]|nr:fumarylacetoacetate hydrolase family protein [Terriglobia bacterium]
MLAEPDGLRTLERLLAGFSGAGGPAEAYRFDPADVVLRAPITHPQKLIGIGLNYRDHSEEVQLKLPKEPLLFGMYASAIIGPGDAIEIPSMSRQVDYEAELAVVIGARTRRVRVEEALDYVAGYTIVNDVSARDLQFQDKQWLRAKSFDTFAPMGPCLSTVSALGAADNLDIELRLNGKTMQKSTTANMIFNAPALVSHISHVMTLLPGDVIATGTPSGVGFVRKPPVFLQPGDLVEIEIEGIGILRNPVVDTR